MTFSIVIPVFNESENINTVISHVKSTFLPKNCDIIVVDGDYSGSTISHIHDTAVTAFIGPKGRALQMNAGAKKATGDIILFLHADTKLPQKAPQLIEEAVKNSNIIGGAFKLSFDKKSSGLNAIAWMANNRNRIARVPFGDQAQFFKRDYFESIGRYSEIPLMEDVEIMKRIRKRGDTITLLDEPVITSARKWERDGVWYGTFRNWSIQILYSLGVSPQRLVKLYYPGFKEASK